MKSFPLGCIDSLKSAEWLQVKNRLHTPFVPKMPVHSLEALELVNSNHEGSASFQSLGLGTQFYAYSLLRYK